MRLEIKGVADLSRLLKRRDQVQRWIMKDTLDSTAKEIKSAEEQAMKAQLDNPTPFTLRGIYRYPAHTSRLRAEVGIKRIQAGYLKYQILGGTRTGKFLGPHEIRLNRHGNIPRDKRGRYRLKKREFYGEHKGIPGVWVRRGGKRSRRLRLVAAWWTRARYTRPRYMYYEVAEKAFRDNYIKSFDARVREEYRRYGAKLVR